MDPNILHANDSILTGLVTSDNSFGYTFESAHYM